MFAISVRSMRPSSLVLSGATEGIKEVMSPKTGEHNSKADFLPSFDREIAIRFNQSIKPLLVIIQK